MALAWDNWSAGTVCGSRPWAAGKKNPSPVPRAAASAISSQTVARPVSTSTAEQAWASAWTTFAATITLCRGSRSATTPPHSRKATIGTVADAVTYPFENDQYRPRNLPSMLAAYESCSDRPHTVDRVYDQLATLGSAPPARGQLAEFLDSCVTEDFFSNYFNNRPIFRRDALKGDPSLLWPLSHGATLTWIAVNHLGGRRTEDQDGRRHGRARAPGWRAFASRHRR
jgi:hypothetical protein